MKKLINSKFYILNSNLGFTLLELLVVITILGMLATVGFGQYRTSQMKARDGQRKSDLSNVARALEMYYNDYGQYPEDNSGGNMVIGEGESAISLHWGAGFETSEAIYMKVLPRDPRATSEGDSDWDYCYMSSGGDDFKLYAKLENENDSDYYEYYSTDCGDDYTYGITSSNSALITPAP